MSHETVQIPPSPQLLADMRKAVKREKRELRRCRLGRLYVFTGATCGIAGFLLAILIALGFFQP